MNKKISLRLKKQFLSAVLCSFLFFTLAPGAVLAQTAGDKGMGVGLGLGLWQAAQESDFEGDGMPMNLFFDWDIDQDWLKFRAGYSSYKAKTDYDVMNKSWTHETSTTNIYVAYRYTMELMTSLEGFAIAGLAMNSSTLKTNNGASDVDVSGIGYLFGGGAFYYFGDFGVGGQLEIYSAEGDFDGVKIGTGATQLQLAANYSF